MASSLYIIRARSIRAELYLCLQREILQNLLLSNNASAWILRERFVTRRLLISRLVTLLVLRFLPTKIDFVLSSPVMENCMWPFFHHKCNVLSLLNALLVANRASATLVCVVPSSYGHTVETHDSPIFRKVRTSEVVIFLESHIRVEIDAAVIINKEIAYNKMPARNCLTSEGAGTTAQAINSAELRLCLFRGRSHLCQHESCSCYRAYDKVLCSIMRRIYTIHGLVSRSLPVTIVPLRNIV
mmetsp:Transcript_11663/g.19133  ORF Transcript_11663/g.19133 Transcript_11663/m.19133 type:complete len:242 (-) Transcript_11663:673-1398(-)